jgi:hypothetical protein
VFSYYRVMSFGICGEIKTYIRIPGVPWSSSETEPELMALLGVRVARFTP